MENSDYVLDYEENKLDPNLYLANNGHRIANFLIDRVGVCLYLIFIFTSTDLIRLITFAGTRAGLLLLFALLFFGVLLSYWVLFEYFLGKTPAKFITRTKVVANTGGRPSFGAVLGRTLCRFIPFEPFSFLGTKPIGWHDRISKTLVVLDEYQAEETYV